MMKHALLIAFLIFLSGCAASVGTVPADFSLQGKEESVVFGHLIIDGRSDEVAHSLNPLDTMTLTFWNASTGKRYAVVCERGGSDARFFVALPPGQYRVTKWSDGRSSFNLRGSFEVERGAGVYIGTIKWVRSVSTGVLSGATQGTLAIEDRYAEEARLFKERYPRIQEPIVRSIINTDY